MNRDFLDAFARSVSDFHSNVETPPQEWTVDDFDNAVDEHQQRVDEAEQYGIRRLPNGEGDFRVVFIVEADNAFGFPDETVLKISKTDGTQQNANEIEKSALIEGTPAEKHIASVVEAAPDNLWLVQQRASVAKRGDAKRVRDALAEYGFVVGDIRRENCGRINSQPVLTDLGRLRSA